MFSKDFPRYFLVILTLLEEETSKNRLIWFLEINSLLEI